MPRATMPLAGRRIIVTRPKKQAAPFVSLLEAQGAEAVCFTTIVIHPPKNMEPLDTALDRISSAIGQSLAEDILAQGAGPVLEEVYREDHPLPGGA